MEAAKSGEKMEGYDEEGYPEGWKEAANTRGWFAYLDDESGSYYYYNEETEESSWDIIAELEKDESADGTDPITNGEVDGAINSKDDADVDAGARGRRVA